MRKILTIFVMLTLTGCSSFFKNSNIKSNWECPNPEGVECISVEYADEIARQRIILNEASLKAAKKKRKRVKKILVNEHEQDFERQPISERNFK